MIIPCTIETKCINSSIKRQGKCDKNMIIVKDFNYTALKQDGSIVENINKDVEKLSISIVEIHIFLFVYETFTKINGVLAQRKF